MKGTTKAATAGGGVAGVIGVVFGLCAIGILPACSVFETAKEISIDAIEYYCQADDATRAALREQYTTSKGPLVQVNCENLES